MRTTLTALTLCTASAHAATIEFAGTINDVNWGDFPGYLTDTQVGDRWSARISYNLDNFVTPDGDTIEPFPAGDGLVWQLVSASIEIDGENFDFTLFAPDPFLILQNEGPNQRLAYSYGVGGESGGFSVVLPADTIGDQLPAAPIFPAFLDGGLSISSFDFGQAVEYSIRGELDTFRIIPAPATLASLALVLLAARRRR